MPFFKARQLGQVEFKSVSPSANVISDGWSVKRSQKGPNRLVEIGLLTWSVSRVTKGSHIHNLIVAPIHIILTV
jgi:hypothetical protein